MNKNFEPNSIVRLLRVRGHANVNAKPRDDTYLDPNRLFGKDTFFVGDPILTLLRMDTKVSVAVLRTTAIHQDGISRSHIIAQTIKNPAAKIKITGQIYSLTLITRGSALRGKAHYLSLSRPRSPRKSILVSYLLSSSTVPN
jgi:hypothetical protein